MADDRYKYFRVEARELADGLAKGVLELESSSSPQAVVARLFRFAHTLKGASRIVKLDAITRHAHQLEELLEPYRAAHQQVPRSAIDALLAQLDALSSALQVIDPAPQPTVAAAKPEQALETVRVDVSEMDAMLERLSEANTHADSLHAQLQEIERVQRSLAQREPELAESLTSLTRGARAHLTQIESELSQIREAATTLRLHPASTLFGALERAARDAAQSLEKSVEFRASGGEIRIDAPVLAQLRDALLHVVRNAVAHGIESPQERARSHKPERGSIELKVQRRGQRVAVSCQDDGRGLDLAALRSAAVERGLVSASAARELGVSQIIELLFQGRLSTMRRVSELSGRGVGLDTVRAIVQSLSGELKLETEPGRGSLLEICVPISLASVPVLMVESASASVALPLDAVRGTFRLDGSELARSAEGESLLRDGRLLPYRELNTLLDVKRATTSSGSRSVVVISAGGATVAVGVDQLRGTTRGVVKILPAWLGVDPIVAGASFDERGRSQLVLDAGEIVSSIRTRRAVVDTRPPARERLPVLVIDDSLTTRMLEQSILESAGYRVELACSAEEGLAKARNARYALFLVDVEMPGMSGFEFVGETRRDAELRVVPAILVTSRSAAEDRARGLEAGAADYIVKGEFDQNRLLARIRELIG